LDSRCSTLYCRYIEYYTNTYIQEYVYRMAKCFVEEFVRLEIQSANVSNIESYRTLQ